MNPVLGVVAVGGLALAVATYLNNQKREVEARDRNFEMQQQLLQARQQAQAPVLAQPTQQGQTIGGSAASIIDGIFGLASLLP